MNNLVYVGQSSKNWFHEEKSFRLSEISPVLRWYLTWLGWIHSHINDLLSQSEIHHCAEISLSWDVSREWGDLSHINTSWNIAGYALPFVPDSFLITFFVITLIKMFCHVILTFYLLFCFHIVTFYSSCICYLFNTLVDSSHEALQVFLSFIM